MSARLSEKQFSTLLKSGNIKVSNSPCFRSTTTAVVPPKASPRRLTAKRTPQDVLWLACQGRFGDKCQAEFKPGIPGRRFRIDIAFPDILLAVEVDGWQYHGKFKISHDRDRERQNLMVLHGWKILRFTAKQIFQNLEACLNSIEAVFNQTSVSR